MKNEQGSATVSILAMLGALLLAGAGIGVLAQGQVAAIRAQTAADAAALAAAPETFLGGDPMALAREYAQANGATLTGCECPADATWQTRQVKVTVWVPLAIWSLGGVGVSRSAVAEFAPVALLRD